jgi:hypothetical protein
LPASFQMKHGVNPKATTPIWYAVGVVDAVYFTMFGDHPVITSMKDGTHMHNSLHHWEPGDLADADAVDVRDRDRTAEESRRFYLALRRVLPAGFDIVLEPNPRHIHIEWQPKEGEQEFLVYEPQGGSNELAQH